MTKKNDLDDRLKKALIKRAVGGNCRETVEEYACDGAECALKLVKRKVSIKYNPPDVAAVKALLACGDKGIEEMSDAELIEERDRLISEIRGGGGQALT